MMELEKKENNDQMLEEKYHNLIEKKDLLKNKKNDLESELKSNITQYDECDQDLIKINYEIDQLNEKLQKAINEKDELNTKDDNKALINSENIRGQCIQCFEEFFMDSLQSLDDLKFEIRFGKIVIFKQITSANMTFKDLKEETKSQFDRETNEFFFSDEKNRIYLDNMNVKKALFPLEKIAVKNTIPRIIVKDIFNYEIQDINNNVPEILNKDNVGGYLNSKFQLSFIDKINRNIQSYKYIYINIILYTLFVVFWVLSCIEFRSLRSFFLIQSTFDNNLLNPGISDVIIYFLKL